MDAAELLIEVTKALSRSYAPSGEESMGETAAEQMENELHLERLYRECKRQFGLAHHTTVRIFFQLFDVWIGLYRLDKCHDALSELMPAVASNAELHAQHDFKLTQSLAFTRWKQGAFREAITLFEKMESTIGQPSAALFENMAHTYSTLGDYDKAKIYFQRCVELKGENMGGVLLGLGILKGRTDKAPGAGLDECLQALAWYEERFSKKGNVSSLEAKSSLSISKMYLDQGNYERALHYATHAVGIFRVTCGDTSPLVASALKAQGDVLWKLGTEETTREQATAAYMEAFKLEAEKDAIDLMTLIELHTLLKDTLADPLPSDVARKAPPAPPRTAYAPIFEIAQIACASAGRRLPKDGNLGAFFKIMAELGVWANDLPGAAKLMRDAIECFDAEKNLDVSGLNAQCRELVALIDSAISNSK